MTIRPMTVSDLEPLRIAWNETTHPDFHLTTSRIQTQIIESGDLDLTCSFTMETDGIVQGGIVIKTWNRDVLPIYQGVAWIVWFHVAKPYQNNGYGSQLLAASVAELRRQGVHTLKVGKDMNNLFCGTADVFECDAFFDAKGFVMEGDLYDLHRHVKDASPLPLRHKTEYVAKVCEPSDMDALGTFFHRVFPGRWEEEFLEYKRRGNTGNEFVILYKDNKVVAFCRVNDSTSSDPMYNTIFLTSFDYLYGVGPLGVDPEYRGLSLGYDVTAYGINTAIDRGATDILIDWTELVDLYRKFGFDIWHKYKAYTLHL